MDDNTASTSSTLLSQIMIGSMVLTFSVVALLFILHVYAKWYWSSRAEDPGIVDWRRRQAAVATKPRGLEPSALNSLPVVSYDPKDFKEGLECAVCLSELLEGEKARFLPKCNHGFHLECIDVWFKSHSTCPLCRTLVADTQPNPDSEANNVDDLEEGVNISTSDGGDNGRPRNPAFPTNVLFWGDDTEVSSSSVSTSRDVELVIQVPTEPCEDGFCSSPDEARSPIMTKLRSLKRLLSRGKRVAMAHSPGTGSSSGAHDQV